MFMEKNERGGFSSKLGFVLAAAGSAIGLGNLWRFPYLAAKDGGGLFLAIYIILALTFGFSLLTTEIAIGRKTGASPLKAYKLMDKRFGFLGLLATIVPIIIFPYYCVIGGWVSKYGFVYVTGASKELYQTGAGDFFSSFITDQYSPLIWFAVFIGLCALVVFMGVEKGIEKASKLIMPALFILIIGIGVYSLTLDYTDPATGETRTAFEGLKVYLVPSFEGITVSRFFQILLDAVGQLFYSLSIAMGIMITYGSYCKKDSNLVSSVNQIEIFDSGVAILAGLIIIPSVYVFQGMDGLAKSGPSLMFISLPQVFNEMGGMGNVIGSLFFVLVFFAALTSAISLMETITSSFIDKFGWKRMKAASVTLILSIAIGVVVCLGYNIWYFEYTLPNGSVGQILDILDYVSNNLMLPIVALSTCILVWVCKPQTIINEVKTGSEKGKFAREGLYRVMISVVAPILLVVILLQSFNVFAFLNK